MKKMRIFTDKELARKFIKRCELNNWNYSLESVWYVRGSGDNMVRHKKYYVTYYV